jgi:hypothetical protein
MPAATARLAAQVGRSYLTERKKDGAGLPDQESAMRAAGRAVTASRAIVPSQSRSTEPPFKPLVRSAEWMSPRESHGPVNSMIPTTV